ncbi:MAG TPA: hypothetical protein ENI61_05450 [Ignavibacteria bacterium]|nr:hypothetical protein [Ignavibacteria bacterium]
MFESITSNPSSLNLTFKNFSLEGYVRNLVGDDTINNTAYNVSFNWTLPSDFLVKDGTANVTYGNLSNSSLVYNNINISFNTTNLPDLNPGTISVNLYAQGFNSSGTIITHAGNITLLTKQINISLTCYGVADGVYVTACGSLDPDKPAESTTSPGGGSGGGGGGGGDGALSEKSDAYFELLRGEMQEFTLPIENKLSFAKKDIKIKVSGINSKYISFYPPVISFIGPHSSKNITIIITAPAYFTKGEYNLVFKLEGEIDSNVSKVFRETKYVKLFIVEVLRSDADKMVNESATMIKKMNSSELFLKDVSLLFESILEDYNKTDFLGVKDNYDSLKEIYDAAFASLAILNELTKSIEKTDKNGIDTFETKKVLYIAQAIFDRGDYLLALEKLRSAKLMFALETKGEMNIFYTIKNNPYQTLLAFAGVGVFSFGSSLVVRSRLYRRKLRLYGEEEKLLLELMKVVQRDTFEGNKMSMEEYGEAMSQYEKKLGEAIEGRIRIEAKVANVYKIKGKKKALKEEKERLINLVMDVQDKYLNKSEIETRVYDNIIKSYTTRLADVDSKLTVIEAEEALANINFFKKLFKKKEKPEPELKIKKVKRKLRYD